MNRNVTAVYRTFPAAKLVRQELEGLGIESSHIHVIPDSEILGERDDSRWSDQLHDLHLPEDDLRTYQHSVRRGDYVVSANVDDDLVDRVQQIMRRPEQEAYDIDARGAEFRGETIVAHSAGARADERLMARRDTAATDPYVRSYRREQPWPRR